MKATRDRTPIPNGTRFGRLVVVGMAEPRRTGNGTARQYKCACDCGNEKIVVSCSLKAGKHNPADACTRRFSGGACWCMATVLAVFALRNIVLGTASGKDATIQVIESIRTTAVRSASGGTASARSSQTWESNRPQNTRWAASITTVTIARITAAGKLPLSRPTIADPIGWSHSKERRSTSSNGRGRSESRIRPCWQDSSVAGMPRWR